MADVRIELSDATLLLIRDLLTTWINVTESSSEVPRTAMRDWHRIAVLVGYPE